jgi:N-acetyl-anhydromuramyl-L-alanine amidase AmpD
MPSILNIVDFIKKRFPTTFDPAPEISVPAEVTRSTPDITDIKDKLPWNINGQKWKYRKLNQIKNIVVHQALGTRTAIDTNKFCINNSPDMTLGRGMPKIAYHYFIEQDGKIYQCNRDDEVTSHVKNMNTKSIAICLGGFYNYGETKGRDGDPSKVQLASLAFMVKHLMDKFNLTVKDVYTHDELQGKPSCPGNAGAAFVKKLRNET